MRSHGRADIIFLATYVVMTVACHVESIRKCLLTPTTPRLARTLYQWALGTFLTGVVIWVFENVACPHIPTWWKLHALWHLLAGFGSYLWACSMLVLRAAAFSYPCALEWKWGMPYVAVKKISEDERLADTV
jgi:hypothetical protein